MKIKHILCCLVVLASLQSKACDACGCAVGANGSGLLTQLNKNFISLQYGHASFTPNTALATSNKDQFNIAEISFRYHITPKLKVQVFQPFHYNNREMKNSEILSFNGVGDARIMASYSWLNFIPEGANYNVYAEASAGIKTPWGKYNPSLHDDGMPLNFNPGNESWGMLLQHRLLLKHQLVSLSLTNFYQINGEANNGYRYGNQLFNQLLAFRVFELGAELNVSPYLGFHYEQIAKDLYPNGREDVETGGLGWFVPVGANFNKGSWTLGANALIPTISNYSNQIVKSGARFSVQLIYYLP